MCVGFNLILNGFLLLGWWIVLRVQVCKDELVTLLLLWLKQQFTHVKLDYFVTESAFIFLEFGWRHNVLILVLIYLSFHGRPWMTTMLSTLLLRSCMAHILALIDEHVFALHLSLVLIRCSPRFYSFWQAIPVCLAWWLICGLRNVILLRFTLLDAFSWCLTVWSGRTGSAWWHYLFWEVKSVHYCFLLITSFVTQKQPADLRLNLWINASIDQIDVFKNILVLMILKELDELLGERVAELWIVW